MQTTDKKVNKLIFTTNGLSHFSVNEKFINIKKNKQVWLIKYLSR